VSGRWFDRLEGRLGGWCIPGLAALIVGMNAAVWALSLLKPEFPDLLALVPGAVLAGQWWRVATFLFIPPAGSPLFVFLWLWLMFTYASALESEWGDFRFNLFYLIGAGSTVLASLALGVGLSNVPLNTTLFLAFARLYPNVELMFFFVLPVRVKWLAALAWLGIAAALLFSGSAGRLAIASGLVNYFVFFGADHWEELERWRRRRRHG